MIVDFHTHFGDLRSPRAMERAPVRMERLIGRLDEEGIDWAVLLPTGASPESTRGPSLFSEHPDVVSQIREAGKHPDRLVPFGNLDPRMGGLGNLEPEQIENPPEPDFSWLLERFLELGCAGIGEITANIPLDDPRMVRLCRQCGERDLPVLFHLTGPGRGVYGVYDQVGSPRLESLLRQCPDTILIGHAPGFWAEIEGGLEPHQKLIYPRGPVASEGSLQRLLRACGNLYGDLSAESGLNAISRDRAFGIRFLEEFQDRLLFGTDVCYDDPKGRRPTLRTLRDLRDEGALGHEAFDKIAGGNAARILKLPAAG